MALVCMKRQLIVSEGGSGQGRCKLTELGGCCRIGERKTAPPWSEWKVLEGLAIKTSSLRNLAPSPYRML